MLSQTIVKIGRPIVQSDLAVRERIRWLSDVSSDNCKNFFQNIFLVEFNKDAAEMHYIELGTHEKKGKKTDFIVDSQRNTSFPIFYPNGGNPLHTQGVYPFPCYLMYEAHIRQFLDPGALATKTLMPRFHKTLQLQDQSEETLWQLAKNTAEVLANQSGSYIHEGKQLGILLLFDPSLPWFSLQEKLEKDTDLWVADSRLYPGKKMIVDGEILLRDIVEARFDEARTLGWEKESVSSFTNQIEPEVASIYNKSWLWLSPTWDMPASIYWKNDEWTKGIKIDRDSYEAYLYGAQFLKQITIPIQNTLLKELFAPHTRPEAKKKMKSSSFESMFGVPLVYPLLEGDSKQLYQKYQRILKGEAHSDDLHMEILAAIKGSIVPKSTDDHRLTILYYSGDLSRGNMHIRAMIEDVIPSVASQIQAILHQLNKRELFRIREELGLRRQEDFVDYRIMSLPTLLANAFGPGYLWSALQQVFHRESIHPKRVVEVTARKLNEWANKEEWFEARNELVLYYAFMAFLQDYLVELAGDERGGVVSLTELEPLITKYFNGILTMEDLGTPEALGFVTGLAIQQFSKSYFQKTRKEYVKHRVMKFGNKLTPELVWKNGLLRCQELAEQWDMGVKKNFYQALPHLLWSFLQAKGQKWLTIHKDEIMTAFWSGLLMYDQANKKIKEEGNSHVAQ